MNMLPGILLEFLVAIPHTCLEVAIALAPIVVIFFIFQCFFLKLPKRQLLRMMVGILYTFLGLVLFLVGVNVGFQPAGTAMGATLGALENNWVMIPVGLVLGFVIVFAEPAVAVLNKQVEAVSGGAISSRLMMGVLCVAMAISVSLGMVRVLTGLSIWWILIPGYAVALILMKFSSNIFTAIAFDSGGVASGPMTATFLLPLAVGAAEFIPGRNPMTDAFGMVALVAMTPLIAVQVLGVFYQVRLNRTELSPDELAVLDDDDEDDEDEEVLDSDELNDVEYSAYPDIAYGEDKSSTPATEEDPTA
jgi:hypothetical protein